ncbi:6401_t:CDS:2, partial [Funneliformis mosseae]
LFHTAYHAISGLYLQIGNMKQTLRQKLKNQFLLGFIPFAATSDEVLQPLINDIQDFKRGYELKIGNQTVWVTGGLGVITSDLPEGNEQAGVKNHNAHYGCCNCMIHHSELDNISFDTARHSRYYHKTILQFSTIRRVQTQAQRDALAMQYEMLQLTFEILSSKGETEFLKVWHDFEFPSYWSRQQNPITHLGSYFFSDYLCLSMIMLFLINRALHITMLNKTFVEYIIETCTITKSQVLDKLLGLWYNTIVQTGCEGNQKFNIDSLNFATLVNISVAMKEMLHKLFKAIISHSNKKNIELDFMRCNNCLQALRFLMDGSIDEKYDKTTYFNFSILSKDRCTAGFEKVLNDDLFAELRHAYKEELDVNLCVGDTVDVLEDISNDTLNNPKT